MASFDQQQQQRRDGGKGGGLPSVLSSSFKKLNSDGISVPPSHLYAQAQNPSSSDWADDKNRSFFAIAAVVTPSPEDVHLSNSSHLTRQEILRRRLHNLKQLSKVYKDHYWALMEELRAQHRDYVWKYGLSPFRENEGRDIAKDEPKEGVVEGIGETDMEGSIMCAFYGCTLKAMALTKFCHLHILSDSKQMLYKPCEYVIKSAHAGPITCGRPILRARLPAFCNVHLQKAQRALKKTGLHVSSGKHSSKFHVIVTEYVRQIQAKRRAALGANITNLVVKKERCC